MSTNLVRDGNKNTEPPEGKMGVVQGLHISQRRNNDSMIQGMYLVFLSSLYLQRVTKWSKISFRNCFFA